MAVALYLSSGKGKIDQLDKAAAIQNDKEEDVYACQRIYGIIF